MFEKKTNALTIQENDRYSCLLFQCLLKPHNKLFYDISDLFYGTCFFGNKYVDYWKTEPVCKKAVYIRFINKYNMHLHKYTKHPARLLCSRWHHGNALPPDLSQWLCLAPWYQYAQLKLSHSLTKCNQLRYKLSIGMLPCS